MSDPIPSILNSILTDGIPVTSLTSSTSTSISSPTLTSATSETISLPQLTSTTTSTLTSTSSSSPTFIHESTFASSSNTPISSSLTTSTSTPLIQSTSTSVPAVTLDITATITDSSTVAPVPTTLVNSQTNSNDLVSRRTAIIAGTTTGLIALLLLILGAVFIYRRHRLRKNLELSEKKREGRSLLDGEEFDDERNMSTMQSYHDHHYRNDTTVASTPSPLKSRTSETGSIFREEVWPPPGFMDPISKQSSQVDLSGIVDDIMGPTTSYNPGHDSSSSLTVSHDRNQPTDTSTMSIHSSGSTSSSFIPDKLYDSDPFRSNSGASLSSSAGASAVMPRASSKVSYPTITSTSSTPSLSSSAGARSRSPNARPKTSSPLARISTSDPKIWLTRNLRPAPTPPS